MILSYDTYSYLVREPLSEACFNNAVSNGSIYTICREHPALRKYEMPPYSLKNVDESIIYDLPINARSVFDGWSQSNTPSYVYKNALFHPRCLEQSFESLIDELSVQTLSDMSEYQIAYLCDSYNIKGYISQNVTSMWDVTIHVAANVKIALQFLYASHYNEKFDYTEMASVLIAQPTPWFYLLLNDEKYQAFILNCPESMRDELLLIRAVNEYGETDTKFIELFSDNYPKHVIPLIIKEHYDHWSQDLETLINNNESCVGFSGEEFSVTQYMMYRLKKELALDTLDPHETSLIF